jgi:hypothetical protein
LSEYQRVIYFCMSFCRAFNKLMFEIDNENLEDAFDLLIVANLVVDEGGEPGQVKKGYIDQVDM